MKNFLSRLIPFFLLGFVIVLLVAGFILLSYLLIAGAIVGLILFAITYVRDLLFKKNKISSKKRIGITIDHTDLKK